MPLFRSDNLIILVALASQQDDVARTGVGDDPLDRPPAVDFLDDGTMTIVRQSGPDLRKNPFGLFRARVVAGHVNHVRQPLRDPRHARALGAIAIPTTP